MALTSHILFSIKRINRRVFVASQPKNLMNNGLFPFHTVFRSHANTSQVKTSGVQPRDPAPFFFNEEVQNRLLEINMQDTSKVFGRRKERKKLADPELKFLTQEELEKEQHKAMETARYYLQLPPVVLPKEDECIILSKDPALQGLDESKMLFIDTSFGISHQERLVVAREPDGTLRHAFRDERQRMIQAYFPEDGRSYEVPKLFSPKNLTSLLERSEFVYVLDRACTQFEPDDPEYVRITSFTYDFIDKTRKYDDLLGTRHYGSMLFYLVFNGKLDSLLNHCFSTCRIRDAVSLVRVYYLTKPELHNLKEPSDAEDINFLKEYINNYSGDKPILSKTLNAYLELGLPLTKEESNV